MATIAVSPLQESLDLAAARLFRSVQRCVNVEQEN